MPRSFQNPVVVIPGITATELLDDYPLGVDPVWTMVLNKEYERIAMHPDDLRYEAIEPAHVVPGQAFTIYDDLIRALRHELSVQADRPTPVFAFPYDWRVDLRLTAHRLALFVDEALARTRLLKHYKGADDLRVDLVGHSMGGLLICEYLAQAANAPVGRVATIGTPFQGSVEALVKITTGMSVLAGDQPREREREAARVTPSVYQLLPSYEGAAVDESQEVVDLFDAANMQRSVTRSLIEFVRLYSVGTGYQERERQAAEILGTLLAGGRRHRQTVDDFQPGRHGLDPADWLAVIGVGERTRIQVTVERREGYPWFAVDEAQFINRLSRSDPTTRNTGDGTVPLNGALPPFLPASRAVCVTGRDLGFLELRDRLLVKVGGFHGLLPSVNLVQRLVVRHLRPEYRGRVWGRRVPGSEGWNPPISGLEDIGYADLDDGEYG